MSKKFGPDEKRTDTMSQAFFLGLFIIGLKCCYGSYNNAELLLDMVSFTDNVFGGSDFLV